MKKKIALLLTAVMAMSVLTVGASADEYPEVTLLVNDEAVESDQPAVIVNDRTMVPLRVVTESLGCTVDWDGATKTVSVTKDNAVASMVVGEKTLAVEMGGVKTSIDIDSPAVIINERTMVPIRFLSDVFGFEVDWDDATRTVSVSLEGAEATTETTTEETTEESTEETTEYAGMADTELKDYALTLDACIAALNEVADDMDDDQAETFAECSDTVATVLKTVDMGDLDADEIEAMKQELDEAYDTIEALAEELDVDLSEVTTEEDAEETTDEDSEETTEETTEEDASDEAETETTTEAE